MSNCVLTSDKNDVQAMRGFSGVLLILLLFPKYPLFAMEGDSAGACQVDGRAVSFTISDSATIGNVDVSPDGNRIAFDHLGEIYVVPMAGGTAQLLVDEFGWKLRPVWSPDGNSVAYISNRTGVDQVWVVGADGGEAKQVSRLQYTGTDAFNPVIHAAEWDVESAAVIVDGYRIGIDDGRATSIADGKVLDVLEARTVGQGAKFQGNGKAFFYFKPAFSKEIGKLATEVWELPPGASVLEKSTESIAPPLWGPDSPLISPDRNWLVYRGISNVDGTSRTERQPDEGATAIETVRVVDRRTGDERVLLGPGVSQGWRSNGQGAVPAITGRFAVSPDSRYLITAYGGKIHKVDLRTGEDSPVPVRIDMQRCLSPLIRNKVGVSDTPFQVRNMRSITLRPDGRQLAFSALRRLYVMGLPDGKPRLIAHQPAGQFQPNYSPDGKWIAFVTWDEVDGGHIWRVSTAGGVPEQLTEVAAHYQTPEWSPDGERLAFVVADDYPVAPSGLAHDVYGGVLKVMSVKSRTITDLSLRARLGHPPAFSADGRRIFFAPFDEGAGLQLDMHWVADDGSVHRAQSLSELLPVGGAVSAIPSPDGKLVAIIQHGDLYLLSCAYPIDREDILPDNCVQQRITHSGAHDPRWRTGGAELEWSFANNYFRADAESLSEPSKHHGDREGKPATAEHQSREGLRIDLSSPRRVGSGHIVLRGARLVTMRGDEVLENGAVHVRDGRIAQVGRAEDVAVPDGAYVMNLAGKTILPGFVDAHAHISALPRDLLDASSKEAAIYLAFGVTTARDPSAGGDDAYAYSELIESGEMIAPRLIGAEALTPSNHAINERNDAFGIARRTRMLGGTFVKVHDGWDRRQTRWIMEAAREQGLNVSAHYRAANYVPGRLDLSTVIDGVTTAEHEFSADRDIYPDVDNFLMMSEVSLNLSTLSYRSGYLDAYFDGIKDDARIRRLFTGRVPGENGLPLAGSSESSPLRAVARSAEDSARMIVEIARAGGNVMIGSHGNHDGVGFHWEMWAHVSAGMTNHEVLRAATLNGARGIGLDDDLGSIEVGKIADLLVLDRNPLEDIRNSVAVDGVMKAGVLRDAQSLDEIWPERRQWADCSLVPGVITRGHEATCGDGLGTRD